MPGTRSKRALAVLLGGLLAAGVVVLPATAGEQNTRVDVAWSGLGAEKIKTIPIGKRAGSKRRVAMSLSPSQVGSLEGGDSIWAGAEVEVSVTCLEPMRQCVGKLYDYSPRVKAQLVLADSANSAGNNTVPIGKPRKLKCSQKLPHRNHHCVLAPEGIRNIGGGDNLPCSSCHVNLVIEAYNRAAKKGHVVVVGTDADSGQIRQDKGTLNAAVSRPGPMPAAAKGVDRRSQVRRMKIANVGARGGQQKVIFSQRVGDLREDEQLIIRAQAKVKTHHLPYGALLQSQLVLSEKPYSPGWSGIPAKVASHKGIISAQNGFNCTRGPSGHRSPCTIRKYGVVRMLRDARKDPLREEPGPLVPLYVNLVLQSKAEFGGHRWKPSHVIKVKRRGSLEVTRFGPEYR